MPEVIISDTSCLILFDKINELEILKAVYGEIIATPEIAEEFSLPLPGWVKIKEVSDKKYFDFLLTQVDIGEASAIALAKERPESLLILDDLKARKLAAALKMRVTGSLAVLLKAKKIGVIENIKPYIDKILDTDFRISDNIIDELLRLNDEPTGNFADYESLIV